MYKIGELSRLCNIPVKTLRYYDSAGLLPPDEIDKYTGYRYYSAAKLSDCYRILALKELGFSLEEIKAQFSMPKEKLAQLIAAKEQELQEYKAQTERRISVLRELRSALKEDESMFDIIIRKSDEIRIAYCRKIISQRSAANNITKEIRSNLNAEIIGGRTVIIDYETEFRTDTFDMGFGVEITGKLPKNSGLSEKIICFTDDTANVICTEEDYDKAVIALRKYADSNNLQIVGAIYKIVYEDGTVEIKLPVVKLGEFDFEKSEKLDVPFENDERVIGRWEMFDLLPCREMFNPDKPKFSVGCDPVKELYFLPNGERYWCFCWTKGLLLSDCGYPNRKSCNRYTIEKIDSEDFMFIEFKSHSYFEGGKPEIWVLKKTDSKAYTKQEIMITDEIPDIPADDERVLGKWSVCDLVRSIEAFNTDKMCCTISAEDLYWRSVEFLDGGRMRCTFKSKDESAAEEIDSPDIWSWVTDNVIQHPRSAVSMYKLCRYGEEEYLFIQWKNGDYTYGGEEPYWYVFKRE